MILLNINTNIEKYTELNNEKINSVLFQTTTVD